MGQRRCHALWQKQCVAVCHVIWHVIVAHNRLAWHYQVWLQEFAWAEQDEDTMLAARGLTLPAQYKQQPLFCFETMMHMLYWSCLAYEHKRVSLQHTHAANFASRKTIRFLLKRRLRNSAGC